MLKFSKPEHMKNMQKYKERPMAARMTLERVLRDDDDASGQTIREWKIEVESGACITIRMNHGDGFILLRPDDVDWFITDLNRAKDAALSLEEER